MNKIKFDISSGYNIESISLWLGGNSHKRLRNIELYVRCKIFKQGNYILERWAYDQIDIIREDMDREIIRSIEKMIGEER